MIPFDFVMSIFFKIHKKVKGNHQDIDLEKINLKKNFIIAIENLNEFKSQIISKSNQMIQIIEFIATDKLSIIKKCIDTFNQALKNKEHNFKAWLKFIKKFLQKNLLKK